MFYLFPVVAFYLAITAYILGYCLRNKPYHRVFRTIGIILAIVGFLLFLAWGILRSFF